MLTCMSDIRDNDAAPEVAWGDGYMRALNIEVVRKLPSEVQLRMPIDDRHHQPMGIVHGGVYCGLVEAACSIGANEAAMRDGRMAVGLDNHTTFLRAVRSGSLITTAVPLSQGRRTAVWEATIRDDAGNVAARGLLRLLCIEPGSGLAGQGAAFTPPEGGAGET